MLAHRRQPQIRDGGGVGYVAEDSEVMRPSLADNTDVGGTGMDSYARREGIPKAGASARLRGESLRGRKAGCAVQ